MASPDLSARISEKVAQQLGYLSRSSQLFDLGYADEAIRIATSLRILFHDRPRDSKDQGSLIKLLGNPPVRLVTTCKSKNLQPSTFIFDGYMHIPGNIPTWREYLEQENPLVSVSEWWNQIIFVIERKQISRKDLVIWAAEKDGGAHADANTHPTYDALKERWGAVSDTGQELPMPPQHLFALRRFALEVLASQELRELASPSSGNPRPENHLLYSFQPGSEVVANRALDIAAYYLKNKALEDAREAKELSTLNRALQLLHELEVPFLTWRAFIFVRTGEHSSAIIDYQSVLRCQPENYQALYGLGFCLRELGHHKESEEFLLKAIQYRPDHFQSRLTLANLYLSMDRYEEAIREYDNVLVANPENDNARINRDAAIQQLSACK
jgi:tetratricopeptide (TPR) repeat protein